jgi:hypothetical protein
MKFATFFIVKMATNYLSRNEREFMLFNQRFASIIINVAELINGDLYRANEDVIIVKSRNMNNPVTFIKGPLSYDNSKIMVKLPGYVMVVDLQKEVSIDKLFDMLRLNNRPVVNNIA